MNMKKRGAFAIEQLGWWLLAIAALVLMVIGYLILTGKGGAALEYIKKLFSFGR